MLKVSNNLIIGSILKMIFKFILGIFKFIIKLIYGVLKFLHLRLIALYSLIGWLLTFSPDFFSNDTYKTVFIVIGVALIVLFILSWIRTFIKKDKEKQDNSNVKKKWF